MAPNLHLIAHLLSRYDKKSEELVTVVTYSFKKDHPLSFMYTKIKQTISSRDLGAHKSLEAALRKGFSVEEDEFFHGITHYMGQIRAALLSRPL
jgi:hypothetical protein